MHDSQVKWKCRKGLRELDILLSKYFEEKYPYLTDEEKLQIESEEENPRIDLFSSAPLNELTDGVTTLFMKKGGRVPFQGGGRDASQADFGGSTSGGNVGGGNGGGRPTMADIAGPTTTTPTTTTTTTYYDNDLRRSRHNDDVATPTTTVHNL